MFYFEQLTTGQSLTAAHHAFHQHLTLLSACYWLLRGTCDRLTLNAQSVVITGTLLAVTLPSLTQLSERWNKACHVSATNTV